MYEISGCADMAHPLICEVCMKNSIKLCIMNNKKTATAKNLVL